MHTFAGIRFYLMPNTYIFDFDGTLANTLEAMLTIANRYAGEFGYKQIQPDEIEYYRSLSTFSVIHELGISMVKLPFIARKVRAELFQQIEEIKPVPGIKNTLLHLGNNGNRLGILTSNSKANVNRFCQGHQLAGFEFIYSGTSVFGKTRMLKKILSRHCLNTREVLYVGDETRDIIAAREMGIRTIAVSWGANSVKALKAENPDFLIHRPAELVSLAQTQ